MDILINVLIITLGYILPSVIAWRLIREMHLKVWTYVKPGAGDIFFMLFPVMNIFVCLDLAVRLHSTKEGKSFSEKFFRL